MQEEIDSLKRHQSTLEDNLLEAMMEVEEHQGQVTGTQQALADARAALASQQTDLIDERGRLQAEVTQLEEQRKQKATGIEPATLTIYDKLRQRFKGQAVAVLQPDGCSMCGVEQTSMNGQAVRSGRTGVLRKLRSHSGKRGVIVATIQPFKQPSPYKKEACLCST